MFYRQKTGRKQAQKQSVQLIARSRLTTTGVAIAVYIYIDCEQNGERECIIVASDVHDEVGVLATVMPCLHGRFLAHLSPDTADDGRHQ